jgi:shikimate dehydrogenase
VRRRGTRAGHRLARDGAAEIGLANRTVSKADTLAEEIDDLFPDSDVRVDVLSGDPEAWSRYCRESDLVVQCTSSGLSPSDPPMLSASAFRPGQLLYDIIYTSRVTPTMRSAGKGGPTRSTARGCWSTRGRFV